MPTGIWLYGYVGLWILLLTVSLLLLLVVRQINKLYETWVSVDRDWGLPLGSPAPSLSGMDIFGRSYSLGVGKTTALIFVSRYCAGCQSLMKQLHIVSRTDRAEIVLIVSSNETQVKLFVAEYRREVAFPGILIVADPEAALFGAYRANGVPFAVVVNDSGNVAAQGSAVQASDVNRLVQLANDKPPIYQANAVIERGMDDNGHAEQVNDANNSLTRLGK